MMIDFNIFFRKGFRKKSLKLFQEINMIDIFDFRENSIVMVFSYIFRLFI